MILAVDMGNTHIVLGVLDGEKILCNERIATDHKKTSAEYEVLIDTILRMRGIDDSQIEGAIVSSVVPPLTHDICEAIKKAVGKTPLVIGTKIKTGLNIRIDDPKTLGADLLVGSVAAMELYGYPAIVIDMGTATTLMVVDENRNFIGGAVAPGVKISLNALSSGTSALPAIDLEAPKKVVSTNTVECMQSGVIYGQAAMLDGMIERMKEELGYDCKVIATGGLSKLIVPYCKNEIIYDNDLMLKGLKLIYEKN